MTFLCIGVVNTLLAQGLYMLFVYFGVNPSLASILGDVLSIACSYVLNMRFTYHQPMSLMSAVKFPLSYIPGTVINALAVFVVTDVLGFNKMFAKLLSLPITIPLNYLCMTFLVGKGEKK